VKTRNIVWVTICTLLIGIGFVLASWSSPQGSSAGTIQVKTVVSVEAKYGKEVPEIQRQDVRAFLNGKRVSVADWVPLRGDQAGLELFVLIDESIDQNVSLQFDDLRHFMNAQPPTTSLGVGYMRNGTVEILQNLTADHALAGKALRMPMGAGVATASPYLSVSDLAKRWPESPNRHEALMISGGIDALQSGPNPPYLEAAIDRTQRTGVQVYAIYASGTGHSAHSMFRINWGQNNLAQLTEETGGEAYFQGYQTPISYAPYLDQLADRLTHQYRLTVLASPQKNPSYQTIRLETEVPNAELLAAKRVYVPAAK
jgi:hypothetical protein